MLKRKLQLGRMRATREEHSLCSQFNSPTATGPKKAQMYRHKPTDCAKAFNTAGGSIQAPRVSRQLAGRAPTCALRPLPRAYDSLWGDAEARPFAATPLRRSTAVSSRHRAEQAGQTHPKSPRIPLAQSGSAHTPPLALAGFLQCGSSQRKPEELYVCPACDVAPPPI